MVKPTEPYTFTNNVTYFDKLQNSTIKMYKLILIRVAAGSFSVQTLGLRVAVLSALTAIFSQLMM